jgi:hypothetical protein
MAANNEAAVRAGQLAPQPGVFSGKPFETGVPGIGGALSLLRSGKRVFPSSDTIGVDLALLLFLLNKIPFSMKSCLEKMSLVAVALGVAGSCTAQSIGVASARPGLPPKGFALGFSAAGNVNFSVQAQPAPGARLQKNSATSPTLEYLASYTWAPGWRLESSLSQGTAAAVTIDALEQFGRGATAYFGTFQVPLRLHRYFSLGPTSRFSLGPHLGLQGVRLFRSGSTSERQPIAFGRPNLGSESNQFRSVQQNTLTYQAGASVNYVAPKFELNAFVRYTNSFGNPVVAEGRWDYDLEGVEQPTLVSRSRLENVAVGVAIRRTFFTKRRVEGTM